MCTVELGIYDIEILLNYLTIQKAVKSQNDERWKPEVGESLEGKEHPFAFAGALAQMT